MTVEPAPKPDADRTTDMAEPTQITTGAETPDAMVADRQKFWGFFTGGLTAAAATVAIILALLWLFLIA